MNRPVLRLAPLIAAGLLAVCGCSPGKGTVSGKVTYKGKPVVWGTVSAVASDNVQYAAPITPQGTYSIPNVPYGSLTVTVLVTVEVGDGYHAQSHTPSRLRHYAHAASDEHLLLHGYRAAAASQVRSLSQPGKHRAMGHDQLRRREFERAGHAGPNPRRPHAAVACGPILRSLHE